MIRNRRDLRDRVFSRDRGICEMCGCDTAKMHRIALRLAHEDFGAELSDPKYIPRTRSYNDPTPMELRYRNACSMFGMSYRRSFWEADHIERFADGGECSMDNLRTLCRPCHITTFAGHKQRHGNGRPEDNFQ